MSNIEYNPELADKVRAKLAIINHAYRSGCYTGFVVGFIVGCVFTALVCYVAK